MQTKYPKRGQEQEKSEQKSSPRKTLAKGKILGFIEFEFFDKQSLVIAMVIASLTILISTVLVSEKILKIVGSASY